MSQTTAFILYVREQFVSLLDGLTVEQINTTPPGFNNNLVWNLAHMIASQQAYLYGKSGVTPLVDAAFITDYGNGTFPKDHVDETEIARIKAMAVSTARALVTDVESGLFGSFPPCTITASNIPLNSIHDALDFILFHEGMHWGIAKAIRSALAA